MTTRPCSRVLVLVASAALLAGCGYSLRGSLPEHIRTVAIPIFANKTQQPAVENLLTRAVVDAFVTSGRLKVVRLEDADSILEGEITGYQLNALSYNRQANVQEYRLTVTLNLRFKDVKNNAVLWQQEGLKQQADFQVQGQVSLTISSEETALRTAAVDIGRAIVNLIVDRF